VAAGILLRLPFPNLGVGAYLSLAPREVERSRNISFERQGEAGFENTRSAELVVEQRGNTRQWVPERKRVLGQAESE
jgi:hypothetical protein